MVPIISLQTHPKPPPPLSWHSILPLLGWNATPLLLHSSEAVLTSGLNAAARFGSSSSPGSFPRRCRSDAAWDGIRRRRRVRACGRLAGFSSLAIIWRAKNEAILMTLRFPPPSDRDVQAPRHAPGGGKINASWSSRRRTASGGGSTATGNRASLTLTGQSRFHPHHHVIWLTLASKRRHSPPIIPRVSVCLASRRTRCFTSKLPPKTPVCHI